MDSARALLEPALTAGDTWDTVRERIAANTAQAWLGIKAAMVTEIWGDCLHVWLAGGDLAEIMVIRPWVERAAAEWGLKKITLEGRRGWARVLKPHGFVMRDGWLEKAI